MDSLYVFIDESGNFDFSNGQGATEWLGLTSLTTTDASEGVMELYQVKHNLIETGYDVERFHATEDKQIVRDAVFPVLAGLQMRVLTIWQSGSVASIRIGENRNGSTPP